MPCEHLKGAFDAAYGENSSKSKAPFEKYRYILRDGQAGVEKIIRALAHLRDSHPRKKKLTTELAYFRRHRHRMHYAEAQAQKLPIGSGVVEAACKTLATQRMKRSGMRWRHRGGQAILTFRALHQSKRFERAWKLLSGTYKRTVEIPQNVVLFPKRTVHCVSGRATPFCLLIDKHCHIVFAKTGRGANCAQDVPPNISFLSFLPNQV